MERVLKEVVAQCADGMHCAPTYKSAEQVRGDHSVIIFCVSPWRANRTCPSQWHRHFPFAFWCLKTVIRDWIDETVRFNFLAMRGRFIPETMSLRN